MYCYNCDSKRLKYDKDKDAYVCLDCGYEFAKQYFFISHSHLDIEKVRIIRNIIEETFFYEPILFFLKCLSDETEIINLLQREIDERIWFVYCKSENAENSAYVQKERQYIDKIMKGGKFKHLLIVELDDFEIWDEKCYDYIRNQISHQIRKTKIFLSYSGKDRELARRLYDSLTRRGFSVWWDLDIQTGANFVDDITQKIKEHSYKDGIFLPILSENSKTSHVLNEEIKLALQNNALILPVAITESGYVNLPPKHVLHDSFFLPFKLEDYQNSLDKLVDQIKKL